MVRANLTTPGKVAAILGIDPLKRVDLDLAKGPVSYIKQALDGTRQKLARWDSEQLPTYGCPTGVIVNYSPDRAVRFDLEGEAVEVLDRAYRSGRVQVVRWFCSERATPPPSYPQAF